MILRQLSVTPHHHCSAELWPYVSLCLMHTKRHTHTHNNDCIHRQSATHDKSIKHLTKSDMKLPQNRDAQTCATQHNEMHILSVLQQLQWLTAGKWGWGKKNGFEALIERTCRSEWKVICTHPNTQQHIILDKRYRILFETETLFPFLSTKSFACS